MPSPPDHPSEPTPLGDAGCVTGRFQPPHLDHLALFLGVLDRHRTLIVAITNPDPTRRRLHPDHAARHEAASNPFTFWERVEFVAALLVEAGIASERFRIVPFPLHDGDIVHHYVPRHVVQYVRIYSPWEDAKARMLESYGYRVATLPGDPGQRTSSNDIREAIAAGSPWQALVPTPVATLVEACLRQTPLRSRFG